MNDANFSPIDRLMEFGMGVGMAQQMVNTMNQAMQTMQIPESARPVRPAEPEWYVAVDGKATGPYSAAEVKSKLLAKEITPSTLVWTAGMAVWQTAESTPQMVQLITQLPPSL